MAWETGSANDPADLLDKWKTFLTTTTGLYAHVETYAGSNYTRSTFSRGGKYFNAYAETTGAKVKFILTLSTGHVSSVDIANQTEETAYCLTNLPTFPYSSYQFFSYANSAYAVVQYAGGRYRHFGIGEIEKCGTYVGGEFAVGTYWHMPPTYSYYYNGYHSVPFSGVDNLQASIGQMSVVRAESSGIAPGWRYFSYNSTTAKARGTNVSGLTGAETFGLFKDSVLSHSGRTTLLPIYCFAYDGVARYHPLGYVDNVRTLSMKNHGPGDTVSIAGDDWNVFPIVQKFPPGTAVTGQEGSDYYGMAYKKVI